MSRENPQTLVLKLVAAAAFMASLASCTSSGNVGGGTGGTPPIAATGGSGTVGSATGGSPGTGGDGGKALSGSGGDPSATVATGGVAGASVGEGGNGAGGTIAGSGGAGGRASSDAGVTDAPADIVAPPVDGGPGSLGGGPIPTSTVHQDIGVHDPSIIWDGSAYYLFVTNSNLSFRSSTNLTTWRNAGSVLSGMPSWATAAVPGLNGMWAPDVSYFNGLFHVYYAGSTFGSNVSVIGLSTSTTLDSTKPGYGWIDQGLIVQSKGSDNYNAIDPNIAFDANGVPWISFGSFWSGIKLRRLDAATGKPSTSDPMLYAIASRSGMASGAIEAASIISHNGFYYLFASFDLCCKGVNSTYRTMVGRASAITGPYVDSAGKGMMQGGGDQLLVTTGRYIGPGGGTAWKNGANYLYAYHYYDGMGNGTSKLQIRPITFTADDWIALGTPLFP